MKKEGSEEVRLCYFKESIHLPELFLRDAQGEDPTHQRAEDQRAYAAGDLLAVGNTIFPPNQNDEDDEVIK